jgi:hypothetical protein
MDVGNWTANALCYRGSSQRSQLRNPPFLPKFPVFSRRTGKISLETRSRATASTANDFNELEKKPSWYPTRFSYNPPKIFLQAWPFPHCTPTAPHEVPRLVPQFSGLSAAISPSRQHLPKRWFGRSSSSCGAIGGIAHTSRCPHRRESGRRDKCERSLKSRKR